MINNFFESLIGLVWIAINIFIFIYIPIHFILKYW